MGLEFGKWLMDVAKYMLTALLLASFFWRHEYPRNGCYSNINNDGNIRLRALVCAP
jgi:hypothetical protein